MNDAFQCPHKDCINWIFLPEDGKVRTEIVCQKCSRRVNVPAAFLPIESAIAPRMDIVAAAKSNESSVVIEHGVETSPRSPLKSILSVGFVAIGATGLATLLFFASHYWILGSIALILTVLISIVVIKALIEVTTAKARAIQYGHREVDLFFKWVKLVLWEQNEGLLFLRDKRIREVVYGLDDGGGMRFIFPIIGDEVKVHVPLTLQLTVFEDEKVSTRESIRLHIKIALWWRIRDREGLKSFYLKIDKEIHYASDAVPFAQEIDYGNAVAGIRRSPKRAELNAAEKWMETLVESCLRKLVSRTSVAFIISRYASKYLHVETRHEDEVRKQSASVVDSQRIEERDATPDVFSSELGQMLDADVREFGLLIEKIEIQEIRLPVDLQAAIDGVWRASLLPAQTSQEAAAKAQQIQSELGTIAKIIGTEAAGRAHIASNMKGMNLFGGFESIVKLFGNLAGAPDAELQKLKDGKAPPPILPGPEWPQPPS